MVEGNSIICFAKDWGGDPTSVNHIMRILSERNQILRVNSIAIRRPSLAGRDIKRLFVKFWRGLRMCVHASPTIHVFNPLVIPLPDVTTVVRVNNLLLTMTLRATYTRLDMKRPMVWSFLQTWRVSRKSWRRAPSSTIA
jgi:hypothetical protein